MSGKAPGAFYNNTEDYKSKTAIATATTQSRKTANGAAVNNNCCNNLNCNHVIDYLNGIFWSIICENNRHNATPESSLTIFKSNIKN